MPITPAQHVQLVLERRLSRERLLPYRLACGGDLGRAIRLYEWNMAVSAAFLEELAGFEVVLRNALHEQLAGWHSARQQPGEWYDDPARVLDARLGQVIGESRRRLRQAAAQETAGRVVAELPFGVWRFLLDKRHQMVLWAPVLRQAFPAARRLRRIEVYEPIIRLAHLRNRIAHHEPIHHLPLAVRHEDLIRVVGYIEPAVAAWLAGISRVPGVLAGRP